MAQHVTTWGRPARAPEPPQEGQEVELHARGALVAAAVEVGQGEAEDLPAGAL